MGGYFLLMMMGLWLIPLLAGIALMGGQTTVRISHAQSGMQGQCFTGFSWTYYLFGWLVPIFRGEITVGFLHLLITIFTAGLFQLVMSFLYNKQYSRRQFTDGWELSDTENQNALARGRLGLEGETNGHSDNTTQAMLFGLIPPVLLFFPAILVGISLDIGTFNVFSSEPDRAEKIEETIAQLERDAEEARARAEELARGPQISGSSPPYTGGNTYYELERPLIANVANSRKVVEIKVAVMTRYGDRVIENIQKNNFAIRTEILDVMRTVSEQDLANRMELAGKIKVAINSVLEKYEDLGGVEEVLFTEFTVQ